MDSQPAQDAQDADLLKQALTEVDRYRSMDRLIPTYHNVVTIAVIEVCGHCTLDVMKSINEALLVSLDA